MLRMSRCAAPCSAFVLHMFSLVGHAHTVGGCPVRFLSVLCCLSAHPSFGSLSSPSPCLFVCLSRSLALSLSLSISPSGSATASAQHRDLKLLSNDRSETFSEWTCLGHFPWCVLGLYAVGLVRIFNVGSDGREIGCML